MKNLYKIARRTMIASAVAACATAFADVVIDKDTTLAGDLDLSGETVTVSANATLDLAGHTLTAASVRGDGAIASGGAYTPVDMVTTPSDLTGYIVLDYTPLSTDRIETRVSFSEVNAIAWVFSARKDNKIQQFDFALNGKLNAYYNNETTADFGTPNRGTDYEVVVDGNRGIAAVNGKTNTFTRAEFNVGKPLTLFSNKHTSSERPPKSLTMYYFRVFDAAGEPKVNLVPMKRVADGTIGLFDTVAGKFYTLTTGSFTGAEELTSVTTASDNTGYVDTGYVPSCTDRVETKMNFARYPTSAEGYFWFFSGRSNSASADKFECYLSQNKHLYVDRRASPSGHVNTVPTGSDLEFAFDFAVPSFSINGVPIARSTQFDEEDFTMTKALRLFANHPDGGRPCKNVTMHYFRVYDSAGNRKVDLVPVKRLSDNAVGFCDRVRGGFYRLNAGEFTPGATVAVQTTEALTVPGGVCAYTASNGRTMTGGTVANLFNNNFTYSTTDNGQRIYFNTTNALPVTFDYDFGEGKVVNAYSIWCGHQDRGPASWIIYGSNEPAAYGAASKDGWTQLDLQSSQSNWTANGECRTKVFANNTAYRYYRFEVVEGGKSAYFDLTQFEYYNIPASSKPGRLHLVSDSATENATVHLGGDLKLVKKGAGTFTASKAGQGYCGGTEVREGALVADAEDALGLGGVSVADGAAFQVSSPLTLSGRLDMKENSRLDFGFASRNDVPLLTLLCGASVPSSLNVGIVRGGEFMVNPSGSALTSGFDFSGTTPLFTKTDWLRRIGLDANGNFVAFGPNGLFIILR